MKDRSIFTIAVALVSFVTIAAPLVSMSGAWLEQEGRIVRSDISFGRGYGIVIDGAPRTDGRFYQSSRTG
jgi:hypothetical protein